MYIRYVYVYISYIHIYVKCKKSSMWIHVCVHAHMYTYTCMHMYECVYFSGTLVYFMGEKP